MTETAPADRPSAGKRYEDWVLEDPAGKDLSAVRRVSDEIRDRVQQLVDEL